MSVVTVTAWMCVGMAIVVLFLGVDFGCVFGLDPHSQSKIGGKLRGGFEFDDGLSFQSEICSSRIID